MRRCFGLAMTAPNSTPITWLGQAPAQASGSYADAGRSQPTTRIGKQG